MRRAAALGATVLLVAVTAAACGDVAKTDSTSTDAGSESGSSGACAAPDVGRSENGECLGSDYGVDEAQPLCCRPCTATEVVSQPAGYMIARCVPADAGTDAADALACPTYDDADKACVTVADCTTVARGCYCGAQPVIGISKSIAALADACETNAANNCAVGCANFPGHVAEDGNGDQDGGTIVVLCDMSKCHTVVE